VWFFVVVVMILVIGLVICRLLFSWLRSMRSLVWILRVG